MAVTTTGSPDTFLEYPGNGFPYSLTELKKGHTRGPLYHYLRRLAVRDVVTYFDDFNRIAIDSTNQWTVANGGGGSVASFAIQTLANGVIRGTTGTANGVTASASLIGPIIYQAGANPGMEIRFKTVTISTGIRMEAGFIDAAPASNTASFNSMDGAGVVPTMFAADSVTAAIDTAATANKFNLVTIGSASNQLARRTTGTTGLAAAGTYQTIRIQITNGDTANGVVNSAWATMWHNGVRVATMDSSTTAGVGAVNASVLLAPWVYFEAINATSKSLDIDYLWTWADRL
jgi:hypothetical protein